MKNDNVTTPKPDCANTVDLPPLDSVALQRLIAEVRQQEGASPLDLTLYNRTYHRHNR